MSNYSRGRELEYEVKKLFEEAGWSIVRGSSSKGNFADMKPDLIATRETRDNKRTILLVLVQCKLTRNIKKPTNDEQEDKSDDE